MEIIYSEEAQKDISFWRKSGNRSIQRKISQLLDVIQINPYQGIGKPEMLKHSLTGFWSRRINHEHRIVYKGAGGRATYYDLLFKRPLLTDTSLILAIYYKK